MMKNIFTLAGVLGVCLFFCGSILNASTAKTIGEEQLTGFSFLKKNSLAGGKTLLVVGGIQGDEPGGFHAASLLATRYTFTKGNVWVVPNLNFLSIIKRSRGVYGDLNRKFATLSPQDPESSLVSRVKSIITDPEVDVVMNLHDGSGFYNSTYVDEMRNPNRWGQSVIIDQAKIESPFFGDLATIAKEIAQEVNLKIGDSSKKYGVKDTKTREGNEEMSKTLTYFAISQQKPAFGVEASKQLNKAQRVYCHLQVLESFMDKMGIEYSRDFQLTVPAVSKAIEENRRIVFYDSRIDLNMEGARRNIRYFPLQKDGKVNFTAIDPLVTILPQKDSPHFDVYHGNERVTTLEAQFFDYDKNLPEVYIIADGVEQKIAMGTTFWVSSSFEILPIKGYRVNIIGYPSSSKDESGQKVLQKNVNKRFSIDKQGMIYRIEIYRLASGDHQLGKDDLFAGMLLVRFGTKDSADTRTVTAQKTSLGPL